MNTTLVDGRLLKDRRSEEKNNPTIPPQEDCRLVRMFMLALFQVSETDDVEFKRGKFTLIWDSVTKKAEFLNDIKQAIIPVLQKWLC